MKTTCILLLSACLHAACARAVELGEPERTAGVGIALGVTAGEITVMQVMPDSPAAASQRISATDRILAVGQEEEPAVSLAGKTMEECVELIRGHAGTRVRLTVLPESAPPTAARDVMLTRDELKNPLGLALDGTLLIPGTAAPELRYVRLSDGKEVSLTEAHRGQMVVVQFWATWCAPCQHAVTETQELAARHSGRKGVTFLTISIDGGSNAAKEAAVLEKVVAHAKKKGWTRTTNGWASIEGRRDWYVGAVPLVYVVGADGKILAADPGAEKLKELLASPPKA
jgi:thiol-disulfide isomerase/thioredoxin